MAAYDVRLEAIEMYNAFMTRFVLIPTYDTDKEFYMSRTKVGVDYFAAEAKEHLASAAQLGKLGQYVETLLHDIAREIRQGNIDADPCCRTEEDSPCRFCEWAPACHFQDGRDRDRLNYILPVKPEEFWREIEGKEAD